MRHAAPGEQGKRRNMKEGLLEYQAFFQDSLPFAIREPQRLPEVLARIPPHLLHHPLHPVPLLPSASRLVILPGSLSMAGYSLDQWGMSLRDSLSPSCPPVCSPDPAADASVLASAPAPSPACSAALLSAPLSDGRREAGQPARTPGPGTVALPGHLTAEQLGGFCEWDTVAATSNQISGSTG